MMTWEISYAALVILGASVVRGYSGFGFALICAITLSLVFPPAQVTPVILCLDLVASAWLFSKTRKEVDWKGLKLIGMGALLTLPLGTLALKVIPMNPMRIFISLIILCLCSALLQKKHPFKTISACSTFGVGMASGFLTGVAAIGGPPVILFYFSSNRPVSVSRASLIAFFLIVDFLALVSMAFYGLLNKQTLVLAASMLLPLVLGVGVGHFLFGRFSDEAGFRRQVILLLIAIAFVSLVKFSLFP